MKGPRRSLFWTVTGMFLLIVIAGTALQTLVAIAVLQPLEDRDARARAELAVSAAATELAERTPPDSEIEPLLARHRVALGGTRPGWIAFRPAGRDTLFVAPSGRGRFLAPLLGLAPPADTLPRDPEDRRPRSRPEVLARHSVVRGSTPLGELVVTRPMRPQRGIGEFEVRTWLLFLPIAAIGSVIAGLVMVRLLVRRLRGLETLAARVAAGDLSVRIDDRSGDEIGRLAEGLDLMTDRLAQARDQVATTERQRRQLFADITHELATPLTSIRGYAETMLDPAVATSTDERTRYVRGVLDESRRLDRLIRDLFELARLEAGATPLERERLDWAALCRNTVQRFEPRFRQAGLTAVWRDTPREAWIEADGHRMEEVLENLLVNALRYVPEGGTVEMAIERVEPSEVPAEGAGALGAMPVAAAPHYRLTVSDDGRGLAPDELPHVFERFYRGAGGPRDDGGSGLGLAIVREIVERHGGTARAQARSPHGLTIVIELPAAAD